MKKAWAFALLGILLLLLSCTKQETAETDLIFEGKTYVVGSGKPPKGQPMKMLIQQRVNNGGNYQYETIDSFYTDSRGVFSYRFKPDLHPNKYLITPEPRWKYDNIDLLFPKKLGLHQQDFRILSSGILKLRIKNANYNWGDSLIIIDPQMSFAVFAGPLVYDHILEFFYPAFQPLNFEYKLFRNGNMTNWKETYHIYDDSTHYHEIIY